MVQSTKNNSTIIFVNSRAIVFINSSVDVTPEVSVDSSVDIILNSSTVEVIPEFEYIILLIITSACRRELEAVNVQLSFSGER